MSLTTKNYNLIKPELTDRADITAFNDNWDKIDDQLKVTNENISKAIEVTPNKTDYYEATLV